MTESREHDEKAPKRSEDCPRRTAPLRDADSSQRRGHPHSQDAGDNPESDLSARTRHLYRKATQEQCPRSQHKLGVCYATGNGARQSWERGLEWYRESAEQGYARAQFSLGLAYYTGTGVEQDHGEAERWFEASAQQGFAPAEIVLSKFERHDAGDALPDDP